tara:strand:- start:525 stop:1046 length:522 start_codon:yes stop_codon:yes gene_type:complete
MKNNILISLTLLIFLFFFVIFYFGLKNSNIYIPNKDINIKLVNFESVDFFNKEKIYSKDLFTGNEFYLINIWASWCIPCKSEHPFLLKFKNESSVKLIGINYKDKTENASKFLKEFKNPFDRILSDRDGTLSINLGAYGVPETFLIKNNKIVKKIIGPIDNKKYLTILKKINE